MALSKDKLIFDEADLTNSDQVGAHIVGSAGEKVSSTNVGGKEGLDVNIISTISTQSEAEHAEDDAHVSGDIGSFILAVRADSDGSLVSADGDYAPLQVDANGRLKVSAEVTVDAGDAEFLEDSAHSSGDAGIHMLAVRQDTLSSLVSADGDYASFKVNDIGELYVHDVDLKAEMVTANASLDAIEASVGSIETDMATVISELQSVNSELDSQTTLITSIDASLTAIEADVDAIAVDVAAIESEAIAINAELDSQTTLLTSMDSSLDAIEVDVAAIEAQTAQLTFDSTRLKVFSDINFSAMVADDAADSENPLKVGSRAVDGALTAISASGDKANVISDMYRRVYVNDAPNVGFKTSAASVTNTASEIAASPLLGRKRIMIQNLGNRAIFIGFNNTISTSNGLRVAAGGFLEMPFGEDLDIFAIADSGTQDIRVVEIA
jgi:hypothetical protein